MPIVPMNRHTKHGLNMTSPFRALSPTFGPRSQKFRKNRNDVFFAENDIYEVKFAAEFKNRIYFVIRSLMTSL